MLSSIFALEGSITFIEMGCCTLVSLILGLMIAGVYMYRSNYSKNFVITLALLPAMIQSVIMVVNGNLGTGVAVMGAFSLVRFRSAPGGAKEIVSIFFAMAAGLAAGMGFLVYAVIFTLIMSLVMIFLTVSSIGEQNQNIKLLKVMIPEDLDYMDLFRDLFERYAVSARLLQVKTTNLGSLYELRYSLQLKNHKSEKEFLDQIRQRNGNLTITCARMTAENNEL